MSFHHIRGNPPLNFFAALRAGAGSLKARLPKLEDMASGWNCARGRSPVHSSHGCDKRDAVKKSAARNGSNQLDYETQVAYVECILWYMISMERRRLNSEKPPDDSGGESFLPLDLFIEGLFNL